MNNKLRLLLVMVSIVAVIAIFFIALPFLLAGSPLPLYSINNNDTTEHQVAVEILNPNNESIIKQIYKLAPKAWVSQPKSTWLVLKMSIPPKEQEEYTLTTTLDNNTTDISKVKLGVWSTAEIRLYWYDTGSPIYVGVVAV